ncbi:proline-rich protein HaeIII subfamily 1-like [Lutra lutra]|uniref:proline-rich protein HaeIII subfamily 1-like n=1 Tax=Lutra lutra TaxID=9657 RepID=UPI001FD4979A|nr:proline-rich protein HaeIII subfamily 1-like [Lutra lutra]
MRPDRDLWQSPGTPSKWPPVATLSPPAPLRLPGEGGTRESELRTQTTKSRQHRRKPRRPGPRRSFRPRSLSFSLSPGAGGAEPPLPTGPAVPGATARIRTGRDVGETEACAQPPDPTVPFRTLRSPRHQDAPAPTEWAGAAGWEAAPPRRPCPPRWQPRPLRVRPTTAWSPQKTPRAPAEGPHPHRAPEQARAPRHGSPPWVTPWPAPQHCGHCTSAHPMLCPPHLARALGTSSTQDRVPHGHATTAPEGGLQRQPSCPLRPGRLCPPTGGPDFTQKRCHPHPRESAALPFMLPQQSGRRSAPTALPPPALPPSPPLCPRPLLCPPTATCLRPASPSSPP